MSPSAATLWLPIGFLCCIVGIAHAGLEKTCTPDTALQMAPQGVCGPNLSDLLKVACMYTGYFSGFRKRAAEPNPEPKTHLNNEELHDFILNRKDASTFLGKRQPHDQHIVCECCWHHCGIREIQQYCNAPLDIKRNSKMPASQTGGSHRDPQSNHVGYRSKSVHPGFRLWN